MAAEYGYARVSTVGQDLTVQLAALERAGIHPSRIYQEKISGVAKHKPVQEQVLAQLKAGDTLTIHRLDRLGRSTAAIVQLVQDLTDHGVRFRCLEQPIDNVGPWSKVMIALLAAVAETERSLLLDRTADGKARRRAEGRHPGAVAMFGWKAGNEDQDPAEAQALATVAGWILDDGLNLSQAVERMNTLDDFPRPRKSDQWRVVSLRRILAHPRTREVIPEQYDKLQQILNRNRGQGKGAGGGRPAEHLLSGILTCGRCGQPMYVIWSTRNGERKPHYQCKPMAGSGGRFRGCSKVSVTQGRADDWAREMFIAAIVSEDFSSALSRRQAELVQDEISIEDLDAFKAEIQDLETIAPTRFYGDEQKQRHAELRRRVEQATNRLMAAPDLAELSSLPRTEAALRAAWSRWTVRERRAWIRRLVREIRVLPAATRSRASSVEDRLEPVWLI